MELTRRQRRALAAICDTFAPGASELGVPDRLAEALDASPPAVRRNVGRLLSVWDAPLGRRPFSALPQARREQVLLAWCDSRYPQRRAAFQALRRAVLVVHYATPEAQAQIGYPGPLGPPASPSARTLEPIRPRSDAELDCDVCVVGSGAGGGAAAAVLAEAGLDVVVLEAGGFYDERDFDGAELDAYRRFYLEGAAAATHDQSVVLLAGACLGGGTVVNYTTSFRTPDDVRAEWAALGVPALARADYTRALDDVETRLQVNRDHSRPSRRELLVRKGLEELGWHVDAMPRNVVGCDQGRVCGYCPFGCRLGAKQSTVKTWLADAHAAGARILVETRTERIMAAGGTHRVEGRTPEGHGVQVRCRAVAVACGALHTPALLRRSGLGSGQVGKGLRLHPVGALFGAFDEEVTPWEGTMQAIYSDQHRDLADGYGLKYETTSVHPGLLVAFAPWRGAAAHAELMRLLPHVTPVGILLRDRDGGEVRVGRDGWPVARYRLSERDLRHLRTGFDGAARILEAAGAKRIVSGHSQLVVFEPGRDGDRDRFLRDADACGWTAGRVVLFSFHHMCSARMGGSAASSACSPDGEVWGAPGVVVCDGSALPCAPGVNPMISIEAVARLNAQSLAARLT